MMPLPGLAPDLATPDHLPTPQGLSLLSSVVPTLAAQYDPLRDLYRLENPAWDTETRDTFALAEGLVAAARLLHEEPRAALVPVILAGEHGVWRSLDLTYHLAVESSRSLCLPGLFCARLEYFVEFVQRRRRASLPPPANVEEQVRALRRASNRDRAVVQGCYGLLAEIALLPSRSHLGNPWPYVSKCLSRAGVCLPVQRAAVSAALVSLLLIPLPKEEVAP